jgi:hypothetical protein
MGADQSTRRVEGNPSALSLIFNGVGRFDPFGSFLIQRLRRLAFHACDLWQTSCLMVMGAKEQAGQAIAHRVPVAAGNLDKAHSFYMNTNRLVAIRHFCIMFFLLTDEDISGLVSTGADPTGSCAIEH